MLISTSLTTSIRADIYSLPIESSWASGSRPISTPTNGHKLPPQHIFLATAARRPTYGSRPKMEHI